MADPTIIRFNVPSGPGVVNVRAGTPGPIGLPGADGVDGVDGADGADGGGTPPFVNIQTDYGADSTGASSVNTAFLAFTADYQGEDVVLYIPPGEYKFTGNPTGVFKGIANLVILGYGATLYHSGFASFNNYLSIGETFADLFGDAPGNTALISSAVVGATSVTCLTAADASKFTVDEWALVAGYEVQGDNWPFNPAYYEFVKVSGVNAGTGVVSFSRYALRDSYNSDWPSYIGFTDNEDLTSGPASIYKVDDGWGTVKVCGVHFLDPFVNFNFREMWFQDCEFDGAPNVTACKKYVLDNCQIHGQNRDSTNLEFDKIVEDFIIKDCYFRAGLLVQSANKRLYIENSRLNVAGTARFTHIVGCDIPDLIIGTRFAGGTEELLIESSQVSSIGEYGASRKSGHEATTSGWTYTNGVISKAKDAGTLGVGGGTAISVVPGQHMMGYNNANQIWDHHPFTITDVYESGGNVNCVVDLTAAQWAEVGDRIVPHPCYNMTVRNCTGCAAIEDLSAAPANSPFWSYVKRRITDPNDLGGTDHIYVRGYVKEFIIDVQRAYTGAQGTLTFREDTTEGINTSSGFLEFNIDVKKGGQRRITRSGNWGIQGTDGTVSSFAFGFLKRFIGAPELSADITGEDPSTWPIIELTICTSHTDSPDHIRDEPRFSLDDMHGSDVSHPLVTAESRIDINGTDAGSSSISLNRFSNGTTPPRLCFGKSRGARGGDFTIVQSGDELGNIPFDGADGSAWRSGANIRALVDGTPGSSDMPGRVEIQTSPDGSATLATRLTIKNNGGVILGVNQTESPGPGNLQMGTGTHAFTNLPASPLVGMIAYVSDSNTATWGATVAAGGANKVLAWYNGTNWTVMGA
jgi:hypothetical protein